MLSINLLIKIEKKELSTIERKTQIMDIAYDLLVQRGYYDFSYADISEKIGIKKASIHYYFPTKENLVLQVIQRYRSNIQKKLAQLDESTKTPKSKIKAYIDYWNNCLNDSPNNICLCMHLASSIPMLSAPIQKELQSHFTELTSWISELLLENKTAVSQNDIQQLATDILATFHGAMLSARVYQNSHYFTKISNDILKFF